MYKLLDAMVIVIIVVGVSFGMWYVDGLHQQRSLQLHELLHQQRSLQLHELSEDITHLRIIIENQNKRERENTRPWGGK
jgi:hypothetical protein